MIKVYCADCGKELYTTEQLTKAPDGPRYCVKHFKERQSQAQELPASVESFLDEVLRGDFKHWERGEG